MSGYTPLPPTVLHQSTRLSHAEAHSMLSSFLERADVDAAYRPDSTLSERGPQSSSTAGNPNLTLHHLNRIKLGMEGQRLGVEPELEGLGSLAGTDSTSATKNMKRRRTSNDGDGGKGGAGDWTPRKMEYQTTGQGVLNGIDQQGQQVPSVQVAQDIEDQWQDKGDYERAQEDEDVDLHNTQRNPGAGLEQPWNEEEEASLIDVEVEDTGEMVDPRKAPAAKPEPIPDEVDKKLRKKLKKERRKDEKRHRAGGK